ncbi:MAG: site-specific DNA-methyltransferase [Candidatus Bathyarchaeia archaeon]
MINFRSKSNKTLVIDEDHIIIFDDFRNIALEDMADLIFADPPFGIGFGGNIATYHRTPDALSYIEVPKEEYPKFIRELVDWCYKALKPNGSMWLVSGWNNLRHVLNAVEDAGFIQLNHVIWKYQFGVFTRRRFVTSHYHLLLLVKDEKNYTFNKPEHYPEDVWIVKRQYHRGEETAGNELPDEIVERCIRTSSNPGDLVVDPVLGSGTTMRVCLKLGRKCLGIEINPQLEKRIRKKLGAWLNHEI